MMIADSSLEYIPERIIEEMVHIGITSYLYINWSRMKGKTPFRLKYEGENEWKSIKLYFDNLIFQLISKFY